MSWHFIEVIKCMNSLSHMAFIIFNYFLSRVCWKWLLITMIDMYHNLTGDIFITAQLYQSRVKGDQNPHHTTHLLGNSRILWSFSPFVQNNVWETYHNSRMNESKKQIKYNDLFISYLISYKAHLITHSITRQTPNTYWTGITCK